MAAVTQDSSAAHTHEYGHHMHNHHTHDHHDHASLAEINAKHFDNHVANPGPQARQGFYDNMYKAIEEEMLERRSWYGLGAAQKNGGSTPIRLLDYACGGGHATRTLLPYVDEAVGIDVSGGSVEAYNTWARSNGHAPETMEAFKANFMIEGEGGDARLHGFDLVVMNMALHHVHDPALLVKRLVQRLKPGTGHLVFIDWDVNGNTSKGHKDWQDARHTAMRSGFSQDDVQAYFAAADGEHVDYQLMTRYTEHGTAFIAKGRRKAQA